MPTFKCPNCHEEISTLDYYSSGSESGYCTLNSDRSPGSHESNDWDSSGCYEYRCPECGDELDPDDLEDADDDDIIILAPPSRDPIKRVVNEDTIRPEKCMEQISFCKKCKELFKLGDLDRKGICEGCGGDTDQIDNFEED